jgi:peptide/nickel transport system permease protein
MKKVTKSGDAYYTATQGQLMWCSFRKHKLAMAGLAILSLFMVVIAFAEFLAPYAPDRRNEAYAFGPPMGIHLVADGRVRRPFVYGAAMKRDPETLEMRILPDASTRYGLRLFARGDEYRLWGLVPCDLHLLGVQGGGALHLFGTDDLGRDILSRTLYATRTSLCIGVFGVFISFALGILMGGVSGYFGGKADFVIQRLIEFVRSLPTIPLWMTLSASLPKEWSALKVYFAITVILSFIGWTGLARRIRGKLITLRDEDYVVAARLAGSSSARIIVKHLLPTFLSYIIVDLSVSFPYMILGETSLSFIGLGLRSPVISWGTLLQNAQNVRSVALHPWLFIPAIFVILAVVGFSFVGDGARDAADPYKR